MPGDRSVSPVELQHWLKRLRKLFQDRRLRYFAVGEYGDIRGRPHYHAVIYGIRCHQGPYDWQPVLENAHARCTCETCKGLAKSWTKGFFTVAPLNLERAKYISSYVVKRMTRADDPRLDGRHPEFARMSTHPGLGRDYMHDVASEMIRYGYALPNSLGINRRQLPLGRYLRRQLAGLADVEVPDYKDTSLQAVRNFAWYNKKSVRAVYSELWSEYSAYLENKERLTCEKKQAQVVPL